MKRLKRKRRRVIVSDGFCWKDPDNKHLIACADSQNVDSLKVIRNRGFSDTPVDLALVDPPYAVSSKKRIVFKERKDMFLDPDWDIFEDEVQYWNNLNNIVKSTHEAFKPASFWVWTSDWWLSNLKFLLRGLGYRVGPSYHWCKPNPMPSVRKRNLASAVEYLVMGFTDRSVFDISAFPKQRNYFVANPCGEFVPAVSPYWVERAVVSQAERLKKRGSRDDVNPTQKPLDMIQAIIRGGTSEGGLVVDVCGGTGTTILAADISDRRSIYVDIDPDQVRAAAARLVRERK